ncbi:hypothetical protein P775_01295 [Puniceibacterium antarcticum]|uniref:histidine kinase n=1 Tax=Puniceibacterium antarcticum TaxID=1206336 RepID=A0A2G8RKV7_9RHOB|nr:HAMP domain-containing sensor histidine kinase [Puniceibacterium antarcticum]PIL22133.1 hypothetical protein P775_01295 [Puniceibacterium antarcticum]
MIVRVFAFFWCANLLTLLLFSILVNLVDLRPPQDIRLRVETALLESQLTLVHTNSGSAGVRALWRQIAPAHESYVLKDNADCAEPNAIGRTENGCFRLIYTGPEVSTFSLLKPATMPLVLGALISAIMAIFLSRWLTRPIRDVSRGLKAIAGGRLDTRILDGLRTSNREIQDLGRDFDLAAERLQALSEGRNRLFHDISHEIRSPLARLHAAVGLIEVNPARGASLVGRMEGDIARLDHLVDEILTLARFEQGEQQGKVQRIDLLDLIENIIADANFEGRLKNVSVGYRGSETLELLGNPELLHRACENVVRNALSHSPQGGTVSVTGSRVGEYIMLEIADEGPGVPETDLKKIFNPFVRVDNAIASQGIGLGLAIASSAIRSHGGEIGAHNRTQGGFLIHMAIPVSSVAAPTT